MDEAQALADKLAVAKPHVRDAHAAATQFWAAHFLAQGQTLADLPIWPPAAAKRFANAAQIRIAALRKAREYDSSDGLAIWLHTARAVAEPRIAPAAREIWHHIQSAGPNARSMAEDLLQDAGLPGAEGLRAPLGFGLDDPG